jgi:hypothetical protein
VNETGYTGAFHISATACANIATVSPSTGGIAGTGNGNGPTMPLTITGLAGGVCTATVTDTAGQTASLPITVTVSNLGINAIGRKP